MRRCIVTFVENKYPLKMQLSGLYMSLKYIQSNDTDLIVFGNSFTLSQLPLKCIKVPYNYSKISVGPSYPFIYSISCLSSPEASILNDYDYILRTDVDTFLTHKWNHFYPSDYVFGKGGYVNTEEVKEKLQEIAIKLGLKHNGIYNIGSTHYGPTSSIKEVHRLSLEVTSYILDHYFQNYLGSWPGWFRGVASLYGSEIAVNHLINDYTIAADDLDYQSTSTDSTKNHVHIHCWHTDALFSKSVYLKTGYHEIKLPKYAPDAVNAYCLYMARLGKKALVYKNEKIM